ncbi:MAG: polysaccharide deacetylase family protein [Kiloniellaceae bacterium]
MSGRDADAWADLDRELDAWADAGRRAGLWWRDDDAGPVTPALRRLLDLAAAKDAPLALAVIPAAAGDELAAVLAAHPAKAWVLQHGYAHRDHAPAGAKKCELVDPAARPALLDELSRGRAILDGLCGAHALPVLVPPWNRLAAGLTPRLPGLGFSGLSACKARASAQPAPGLLQVNCHLDIMAWRPQRRFLGTGAALEALTGHLAARRLGGADPEEPSGILSHHQVHDDAAWDFLGTLLARLAAHPGARLLTATEIFAAGTAARDAGRPTFRERTP